MEVQPKWSPIAQVVPLEVVGQHPVDVFAVEVWRAAVHHATHIVTCLQLVHDQFPDARITPRWTVLVHSSTAVGHLVVQGIRPKRRIGVRGHHGGIVNESELLHHEELTIPTNSEERNTHTTDLLHAHSGKLVDDVSLAHHFIKPVFDRRVLGPPHLWTTMATIIPLIDILRNQIQITYVTECTAIS